MKRGDEDDWDDDDSPYDDLYGGFPPHEHTETSRAAAEDIRSIAIPMRERVFAFIRSRGNYGAIDEEIEIALGMKHQTASARRRELVLKGRVVDSLKERLTRGGSRAAVWVVAQRRDPPSIRPKIEPARALPKSESRQPTLFEVSA